MGGGSHNNRGFGFEVRGLITTDPDGLHYDWSDETRATWDTPSREQLKDAVVSRFTSEQLDEFVIDMKDNEASDINNGGVDDQFDYLAETAGLDWILNELLTGYGADEDE